MATYEEVLELILKDISPSSERVSSNDTDLLDASKKENSEHGLQYDKRDGLYSDLLKTYIDVYDSKAKWNKWFKLVFFVIALLIFLGIVAVSLVAIVLIAVKADPKIADVAVVLSSMASIISAIIVLPKIIAEHLFPTNEDEKMIEMVKNMQVNDSKIRTFHKGK